MDRYGNYDALRRNEQEGLDFAILQRPGRSALVIMAPHGGGIEPGTVAIAKAIAGREHGFYAFKGLKAQGNAVLHLTSTCFDEPRALAMAARAEVVVTIHGHHELEPVVFIGGRHLELRQACGRRLIEAGFDARIDTRHGSGGLQVANLCNRGRSGRGVQLEISRGLRELLFDHLSQRSQRQNTGLFQVFIAALRQALSTLTPG